MTQKNKKDLSVVLGAYNRKYLLKLTIDSIREELRIVNLTYEIIVIDGGSTDGTLKWLLKQKDIISIVQHNHGSWRGKDILRRSWGYFMNLGFKCAQGKYICMISDDCLIVPGAIKTGIKLFDKKLEGGDKVGGIAFYWRESLLETKYKVGLTFGKIFINHGLFLKEVLLEVGLADEESYDFYCADGDLSLKIWSKGYKVIDGENSYIEHMHHFKPTRNPIEDQKNYEMKWKKVFLNEDISNVERIEKTYCDPHNTKAKFSSIYLKCYRRLQLIFNH